MIREEQAKIRKKIQEEIKKLEGEIPRLEEQTQPIAPDNAIGRLSRMEAIGSKGIQEAALRSAKQRLSQLKLMLSRIDDEDFGLCRECDQPIPIGRLLVMPEKSLCVQCAGRAGA